MPIQIVCKPCDALVELPMRKLRYDLASPYTVTGERVCLPEFDENGGFVGRTGTT